MMSVHQLLGARTEATDHIDREPPLQHQNLLALQIKLNFTANHLEAHGASSAEFSMPSMSSILGFIGFRHARSW